MPRKYDQSEPRRPALARPYTFPSSDNTISDFMALVSMACSGLAMISRFAIWPWLGILLAVSCLLGQKKLASPKPGQDTSTLFSGWTCLMFGFTSLLSIYTPLLMGQVQKAGGFPIGFNAGLIPVPRVVL